MSETKTRFYHLYADGKTVKELSWATFISMCNADMHKVNTRLLASVHSNDIYFHKGKKGLSIRVEQLRQIL